MSINYKDYIEDESIIPHPIDEVINKIQIEKDELAYANTLTS